MKKLVIVVSVNYFISLIFLIVGLINKYETQSALSRYFVLICSLNIVLVFINIILGLKKNDLNKSKIDIEIPPLNLNFEELEDEKEQDSYEYSNNEPKDEFQEFDIGNIK